MQPIQRKPEKRAISWAGPTLLLALVTLAGCETLGLGGDEEGDIGLVEGFAGLVAADEPRATVVGREVLANGGNAADAAVAIYFTMAVTLPSRAGLGGGGVCVVFDNEDRNGEAVVFLPRASGSGGVVPSGVRAMAALHARQGVLRWGELLRASENLARFGHGVSRAFARDLSAGQARVLADPELARTFQSKAGEPLKEGDQLVQLELAGVLSGIRAQGAAYIHNGPFANRFAEQATAAGMPVTQEELRDSVPLFTKAVAIDLGLFNNDIAYFPPPPAVNGVVAAELWQMLAEVKNYDGARGIDRAHLFVEAAKRAFADRANWMTPEAGSRQPLESLLSEDRIETLFADYNSERTTPAASLPEGSQGVFEDPAGASFVVADRFGNAVACSVTMNGLFGSGRMAQGTGLILAAPATPESNGFLSPTAVIIGNTTNGDIRFAGAASGGAAAPTALVGVLLGAALEDRDLDKVMRAARLHHSGQPDEVFYESGLSREIISGLQSRGHSLQEAVALGRVNALYCPTGVLDGAGGCRVVSDPRGAGLATVVQ